MTPSEEQLRIQLFEAEGVIKEQRAALSALESARDNAEARAEKAEAQVTIARTFVETYDKAPAWLSANAAHALAELRAALSKGEPNG